MKKICSSAMICLAFMFVWTAHAEICTGFGPQTPRDISKKKGSNTVKFNFAPEYKEMNLCNIHFHKNAEHKGPEFSVNAGSGKYGGYMCNSTSKLLKEQLSVPAIKGCKNIAPGETIEIHWVHTSCDVEPGVGLGACLSDACANPQLRVETQVYLLVNDKNAVNLMDYDAGKMRKGYHQALKIPTDKGAIQFLGSTTGPSYTEQTCSPLQVTWNVAPSCQKMDISSVHKWCQSNKFKEVKAHGVRQLVKDKKLLSKIN